MFDLLIIQSYKKKIMKAIFVHRLFIIQGLILFFAIASFAQDKYTVDKQFDFDGDKVEKTIPVNVQSGAENITFSVEGKIDKGALTVTIFDPEGNQKNGFVLVCAGKNNNVQVITSSGQNSVNIDEGDETFTISTNEGESEVSISSGQNSTISVSSTSNKNKDKEDKSKIKIKGKKKDKATGFSSSNSNSSSNTVVVSGYGNSQVSVNSNNNKKGAKGVMVESFDDPMAGEWRVEIKSEKAEGELDLKVEL